MDTLFGDLVRLVSASDLDSFDVLSFNPGYGWYYTQGQFTIFQNSDRVINSWQVLSYHGCLLFFAHFSCEHSSKPH